MRALLDVNFLVALLDADHTFYDPAQYWFAANIAHGWASCPLTQNGVVRITSSRKYSEFDPFTVSKSIKQLEMFIVGTDHEFCYDDLSLMDPEHFNGDRIMGPKQITDVYLLALAARHNYRLVSFDNKIPMAAARMARTENLVMVSPSEDEKN